MQVLAYPDSTKTYDGKWKELQQEEEGVSLSPIMPKRYPYFVLSSTLIDILTQA
ncbi:MAG: hypothetical protein QXU18_07560 [Thermoplasmatales archaeon]